MAIKTITVLGNDLVVRREGIAASIITPGHLLEGPDAALAEHSVAAGTAVRKFAVENDIVGNGIDDDYAAADTVLYGVFPAGTKVYAIAGTGGVTAEDIVESDGGTIPGALRTQAASAATAQSSRNSVVGKALTTATVGLRFVLEVF